MSMNSDNRPSSSHRHWHLELADVGLLDYWRALVSQRWLIFGIALAGLLLALVITLLMPEKYRATSTLQIERDSLNVVNVDNLMPVESPQDRDFYQTQYQFAEPFAGARGDPRSKARQGAGVQGSGRRGVGESRREESRGR